MMAGQFNEIIQLYSSTEVENDYGERTVERTYVMTTRAKVEETSGTRQNENNEIVYNHNKTFYVRSYVRYKIHQYYCSKTTITEL